MKETTIQFSDDKSIELNSLRILQHLDERTNQIMLKDFENYEIKTRHIGNYKTIVIVFLIICIITIISNIQSYFYSFIDMNLIAGFGEYLWNVGSMMKIWTFFLALSLFFFIISRRYFVRINGKYNFMEFRIANPRSTSVKKFLATIVNQSNIVKKIT